MRKLSNSSGVFFAGLLVVIIFSIWGYGRFNTHFFYESLHGESYSSVSSIAVYYGYEKFHVKDSSVIYRDKATIKEILSCLRNVSNRVGVSSELEEMDYIFQVKSEGGREYMLLVNKDNKGGVYLGGDLFFRDANRDKEIGFGFGGMYSGCLSVYL